jgi:hypothetical protein
VTAADVEQLQREIARLRRAIRLAFYGAALSIAAMIAIGVGNVAYTNRVDEQRRAEASVQAQARQVAGEQTRQLVCSLAVAQAEAFRDATSDPGRRSRDAWQAMIDRFACK